MWLWSVHSCFQWYKNYKTRPRNARVVVENIVASFFPDTVYIVEAKPSYMYSDAVSILFRSNLEVVVLVFFDYSVELTTLFELSLSCNIDIKCSVLLRR